MQLYRHTIGTLCTLSEMIVVIPRKQVEVVLPCCKTQVKTYLQSSYRELQEDVARQCALLPADELCNEHANLRDALEEEKSLHSKEAKLRVGMALHNCSSYAGCFLTYISDGKQGKTWVLTQEDFYVFIAESHKTATCLAMERRPKPQLLKDVYKVDRFVVDSLS